MGGSTWKGSLGVILFLLVGGGNAFAFDRTYCDPATDPDNCECPSGQCTSQLISDLPTTDDPALVRQQSNLTTNWDSAEQAWRVEADVTAMKTGVIRVTSSTGIYPSANAFYGFMSTLLGATMPNQLSVDGTLFPPIILEQNGVSHRLNETTERWDSLQTRNLIFDMMLAPDGSVTIDGEQLQVFSAEINCAGTDPKSYDEQQDGPLLAAQCSVARVEPNLVGDGTSSSGPGPCADLGLDRFGCIYLTRYAQTSIETLDTDFPVPGAVQCSGIWPSNWPSTLEYCDFSMGTVIRPRVPMDTISMKSFFFNAIGVWDLIEYSQYEYVQMSTLDSGVCTNSIAQYSGFEVSPETRDGAYNTNEGRCRF